MACLSFTCSKLMVLPTQGPIGMSFGHSRDVAEPNHLEISYPLGEGVNVVVPPEPYFPTTLDHSSPRKNTRRHKSTRPESLQLQTGWPIFQHDRCTISLTKGDSECALETSGRHPRRYGIASDLSDES